MFMYYKKTPIKSDVVVSRWLLAASFLASLLVTSWPLQAADPLLVTPEVIKSENDDRLYRYIVLPNQLRVLLISDAHTDKAAASLDVNVGSGDDPEGRPGLAHFLEHMLFLGTKKYPKAGEYQQYIDSHGGSHNAYTSLEHTNYFFDIDPHFLEPALDRFAQFFVEPLLDEPYVNRERNAVHSEFMAKIQNEGRRAWDVYREVFNPANKSASFGVGNLTTLADRGSKTVRKDLLAFYQQNYSANRMALTVSGKESLDVLEKMVKARFSDVPNKSLASPNASEPLFLANTLPAKLLIKPQQDQRELSLTFPIPVFERWYREKPVQYLSFLLGHEGEGSLYAVLRDRGWVESLSAGASIANRQSAAFSISMNLTREGYQHQEEIIDDTFRMIALLKQEGIDKWRYNEQSVVQASLFQYQEKGDALNYAATLANNLHYYPAAEVIQGPVLMRDFDGVLIKSYLDHLRPDNVLIEINGPDVKTTKKTRYYEAAYSLQPIDKETYQRWEKLDKNTQLRLPPPNEFVAKNFKLKIREGARKRDGRDEKQYRPVLLRDEKNLRLWFQQDHVFDVPRSGIYLYARSVQNVDGVQGAVLTDYFVRLLNRYVNSFSYSAGLAGLSLQVNSRSRGVAINIDGYSDKQGLLLTRTLDAIAAPAFSQQDFDKVKEELLRELQNRERQSPYLRLRSAWEAIFSKASYEHQAYQAAAKAIALKDVQEFSQRWLRSLNVDALIHGNVAESDALKLSAIIDSKLLLSGRLHHDPQGLFVRLPASSQSYVYTLPVDHPDVAVMQYWQGANDSIEEQARMSLLSQLMGADFFHELRTQQQLGYVVYGSYYPLARVPGMVFLVQSPSHSAQQIDSSMTAFLVEYAKTLAAMKPEQFEQHRAALLHQLQEAPKSLAEQGGEWWVDIANRYMDFDHRQQLVAAISDITQKSLADYYWKTFLAPERRKLLVVAANKAAMADKKWLEKQIVIDDIAAFKTDKEYFNLK